MKWTAAGLIALALAVTTALLLTAGGCEPKPQANKGSALVPPHVRVRLLAAANHVVLTADRPTQIQTSAGQSTDVMLEPDRATDVTFDGRTWHFGAWSVPGPAMLRIGQAADGSVAVNGATYRGAYLLAANGPGKIDVINDVDVENYLRGVLAKELLPDWHAEAYRAQAVIARTYALYEARTGPAGRSWDLNPDERSQVYGGMKGETAKSNAAVDATRGLVVAYGPPGQEKIFKAYFSSCCGGTTSSAADVFNEPAIPPLSAHSNGTTCSISTRYNWPAVTISKAELTRRFRAWGAKQDRPEANLPGVRTIAIAAANPLGRPTKFVVTDTRNQTYPLTAEQMRWAINTDPGSGPTVFSGFFQPVDTGDNIRFANGHGFGHGVGACQWCMQARAAAGEKDPAIVTEAYPQSVLVTAY